MNFWKTSFLFLLTLLLCSNTPSFAQEETTPVQTQAVVSYTNFRDCIRLYKIPAEKLFVLALSSVNANKFDLLEIQSRNGYIIFETQGREFLLSIMKKDKNLAFLKLTPADNNYYFPPAIPQKIFNYIDTNFEIEIKELKL